MGGKEECREEGRRMTGGMEGGEGGWRGREGKWWEEGNGGGEGR